ncbi:MULTISPECIES: alpha/beta family hydrolase [Actinoalloteichus]|uniref:Alpha/beta hydrolase superfamily enzyme, predicted hydrolase n=1 Tax=Actinoalloteichus fjordicus TaxID=1612552 RepID=A0AAC9LI38_9PSEU|nr:MULTISPECIES: alpha/beta family hydrolase [Actinoalloteichus]APU17295.1 alpha/beta hydrolase superfamily enzyme, predicted hydrolase [Actinoalloteichus fjordicus]APU23378.1 alpha/beta hydrolase superfamily enzyme, predicted hydrolase [Actinoalloteichus sp. GBA129-24]
MTTLDVETPHGPALVELHSAEEGTAVLLLGHGAGGGVDAPDLVAAARGATAAGVHVALVQQPYRVAGRRAPAPARQLDAAWLAVARWLGENWFRDLPMVFGGRSSGARVACRTASAGGAAAVLCLAFPVAPPKTPERHRLAELDAVDVPLLVVQGERDAFGRPESGSHREVVVVAGDHALKADPIGVTRAVEEWLVRVLRPLARPD